MSLATLQKSKSSTVPLMPAIFHHHKGTGNAWNSTHDMAGPLKEWLHHLKPDRNIYLQLSTQKCRYIGIEHLGIGCISNSMLQPQAKAAMDLLLSNEHVIAVAVTYSNLDSQIHHWISTFLQQAFTNQPWFIHEKKHIPIVVRNTIPKTNSSPPKRGRNPKGKAVSQPPFFRSYKSYLIP